VVLFRNVRGSSSSRVGRRRLRAEVEESCEQLSAPVERGTAEMERVRTPGNEESACGALANIAGGEPRCRCLSAGEDLALPRREGGKFNAQDPGVVASELARAAELFAAAALTLTDHDLRRTGVYSYRTADPNRLGSHVAVAGP